MAKSGVWRTISGRRVFIGKGQTLTQAMADSGKFKNLKKSKGKSEYEKLKEEYDKEFAALNKRMEDGEMPEMEEILAISEKEKKLEALKKEEERAESGNPINENIKVDDSFNKLSSESQDRVLEQLNDLQNKYGDNFEGGLNVEGDSLDGDMYGYHSAKNGGTIVIDTGNKDVTKSIRSEMDSGWMTASPKGKELEAVVVHEYGHHLQRKIADTVEGSSWGIESARHKARFQKQSGLLGDEMYTSDYAKVNNNEWFAESFANYYYNGDSNTHGKAFGEFLKKELSQK